MKPNTDTTHQNASEALRKEVELYRRIIEALSDFVFIFDENFVIHDVIMASSAVLLHPKEELIGIDAHQIYSPEVSKLFVSNIRACLQDNQQKEIEYPLEVDEQTYYFQARIAPYDGEKVLALIHDITDRVMSYNALLNTKQKADEADKMKTIFLSNMSHEIRTPLNAIIGFSDVLAVTEDPQERALYQSIVQKNTKLMLQLVESMLELSRIDSGEKDLQFEPCLLNDLVQDSNLMLGMAMPEGVEFIIDVPRDAVWQKTDKYGVKQIVSNFITNAIKNTTKGSITVKLEANDEWSKISVIDTGCGIPKDKLSTIFNRFEKLDDFKQGVGLGLSLCQSMAKRLNGCISVESEVGVGSTFSVLLQRNEQKKTLKQANAKKRVLLVDELELTKEHVEEALGGKYEVLWANNTAEAENLLSYENLDLLLIDMNFVDSQTPVELIVKARTQLIPIPVIAVTGQLQYSEQQRARHAGCGHILSKPYAPEQLNGIVTVVLKDK